MLAAELWPTVPSDIGWSLQLNASGNASAPTNSAAFVKKLLRPAAAEFERGFEILRGKPLDRPAKWCPRLKSLSENSKNKTSGATAMLVFAPLSPRLKSCPDKTFESSHRF